MMHVALACLERELETLETNHAITARALADGSGSWLSDPEGQQALREAQIVDLRAGIDGLSRLAGS